MKAFVLHPYGWERGHRSLDDALEEAVGLTEAIGLKVVHAESVKLAKIRPSTFLTQGHVERIGQYAEEEEPEVVIFDGALSPVQQRNLEKEWQTKVIDRTGLILEIFGERAQTKEGKLQVELAAMTYQRSRLVRSWTHLERQRGGYGFLGGPGETQIELDRRLIGERIVKIKKDLEKVRNARALQRKAREKVPFPTIALVGYTNAGKSTLFNLLTKADVFAKDILFATLDPTTRRVKLPSGKTALFSDTVGFITDLPTQLIAAFRATLEQVESSDIILHVADRASPDFEAKREAVLQTLAEIGISEEDERLIDVWNKADLLDVTQQSAARRQARFTSHAQIVSAVTGQGIEKLLKEIEDRLFHGARIYQYKIESANGKALAWLRSHGDNQSMKLTPSRNGQTIKVSVTLSDHDAEMFAEKFGY